MSSSHEVIFRINKEEYFVMRIPFPILLLEREDQAELLFHSKNHQIFRMQSPLFKESCSYMWVSNIIHDLKTMIYAMKYEDMEVSHAIIKDIGFYWNQQQNPELYNEPIDDIAVTKYWLFDIEDQAILWMYKKNRIITLAITPAYTDNASIPYPTFMEAYKPYVISTVELSTLDTWMEQIRTLEEIIEKNYAEACRLDGLVPTGMYITQFEDEPPKIAYNGLPSRSVKQANNITFNHTPAETVHVCLHHQE